MTTSFGVPVAEAIRNQPFPVSFRVMYPVSSANANVGPPSVSDMVMVIPFTTVT